MKEIIGKGVGCSYVAVAMALGCLTAGDARAQTSLEQAQSLPNKAARQHVHIVGSSTMATLTNAVADEFARKRGVLRPVVDKVGSREGIRQFCAGIGLDFPDIVASSRRMSKSEFNACVENRIVDIIEVPVGYDAIVVVTQKGDPMTKLRFASDPPVSLEPRHIYLALAAEVPRSFVLRSNVPKPVVEAAEKQQGEDFVPNPFTRWAEIDSRLPNVPIRVRGPELASGTRDFIHDVFMEGGCRNFRAVRDIYGAADRVRQCTTMRSAPYFDDVREPFAEKVVRDVLDDKEGTLGFVPYDVYDEHKDKIESLPVFGVVPSQELIASGEYPLRRRMYYYVKRAHMRNAEGVGVVRGLREFMAEVAGEAIVGEGGFLDKSGLIPLSLAERDKARRDVAILRRLER